VTAAGRALALVALARIAWPAGVSAQCPDGSPPPCRARLALDTARYLILPFTHREGTTAAVLDGADCAELLTEAFERWSDVRLADKTRVYDALERRGVRVPFRIAFDTGLAIARQLGSGRLVMGQLWTFGDTLRVRAGVYDAARGGPPLREASARVPDGAGPIGAAFNAIADSLLGATAGATLGSGAEQTRSLRALGAYTLGLGAIRTWNLTSAAQRFRAALAADSSFAHAYLWLGQALLWAADSSPAALQDRATISRRTGDLVGSLAGTDRALLLAQQAMFQRRWPDACARYREILAADSTSFAAWYGLAECNVGDPVVIRDPRDTTRYVFRGSWHTAVLAYRRALLLAPSFNFTFGSRAAERLTRILPVESYWLRGGVFGETAFYAFPELEADTLAFHPFLGSRPTPPQPVTNGAARNRNRAALREVTSAWAAAFPRERRAHRAFAQALEVTGDLLPTNESAPSAVGELRLAERLEPDRGERTRDVVDAIRILIKAGDFTAARRLGDSLLGAAPRPIAGVAGVAVLLGRPSLAARLVAPEDSATKTPMSADNQPVAIPLGARRAGLVLLAFASAGAPRDSIIAYERRIEELTASLPDATRPRARSALLDVPAELVFQDMGARPAHRLTPPGPPWDLALQSALSRSDTAWVRTKLDAALRENGGVPADPESPPDGVYLEAQLRLAIGDTNTAERALDAPLNNLAALHTMLFRYLPLAGALVRMMALRAELATMRGQPTIARRWAGSVVALWSGAEPALQPTVTRMKRILQGP
jgi:hypothetical protein